MIVHGAVPSPCTRKVLIVLEEKNLNYEIQELSPFPKTEELYKKNPQGYIPVLEVDGKCIPDSSAICGFIEKTHPNPPLFPEDPYEYADALFLEEYADTSVMGAIGPIFFERFLKPNLFGGSADESRVSDTLENKLPVVFDYLEERLSDGATSILPTFSVADAALGSHLTSLNLAGESIDSSRWPKLASYHKALQSRPSFRSVEGSLGNK